MSDYSASYIAGLHERPSAGLSSAFAWLTATVLLATLLISFEPFAAISLISGEPPGPNFLNQVGFSALGLLSVMGMAMLADRRSTAAVLDSGWLIIVACLFLSTSHAIDPPGAIRSVLFTLFVVVACAGVLAIPNSPSQFRMVLVAAVSAVLVTSYLGLVLVPDAAIHQSGGNEAQHEGLWRGVFSHKNVAGPVMAAFLFVGIYLMRCGNLFTGVVIVILSAVFVIQTGSKTTNGMVPVAIAIVFAGRALALRWLPPVLCLIGALLAATFTIGAVYYPSIASIVEAVFSDPTYTGRTTLWKFGLESIAQNPWLGFGFDSFWLKPVVTDSFLPIDADWDYREIVHGHNNFIDLALYMGIPSAVIVAALLCIRPLYHYMRCRPGPENRRLADLFLMVLVFALLNSFLESTWFRRADPTWVMMAIAVLGLRMTAILNLDRPSRGNYAH